MAAGIRVLHVATGDAASAAALETWLDDRAVVAVVCNEALEAVTLMLTEPSLAPDCVLIGTEWLQPDEQDLIDYVRAQWPQAWICVYGRGAQRLVDRHDDRMRGFDSAAALLARAGAIIEASSAAPAAAFESPPAPRADAFESPPETGDTPDDAFDEPGGGWEPPAEHDPPRPGHDPEPPPDAFTPPRSAEPAPPALPVETIPPIVLEPTDPSAPAPCPQPRRPRILTEEELSALLQDHPHEREPE